MCYLGLVDYFYSRLFQTFTEGHELNMKAMDGYEMVLWNLKNLHKENWVNRTHPMT